MNGIVRRSLLVTSLELRYLDNKPITVNVQGKYTNDIDMRKKARKALKYDVDSGKIAKDSVWAKRVSNFDFAIGEHVTVLHHYTMKLDDFVKNATDFKPQQVNN